MKKESWALGLSMIAILISIACCFIKIEPVSYDYMGILVGVLSLLVTTLIGWQIFTFIDVKKNSQDLQKISAGASIEIQKSMAVSENTNWMIYHYLLLNKDPLGLEHRFLYHGIACLYHTSLSGDIITCNAVVKGLLECIVNPKSITITKSGKGDMLKLLSGVKHTDKIEGFLELLNRVALISVK